MPKQQEERVRRRFLKLTHADEIAAINFPEDNSNLGGFPRLEGL